MQVSRLAVRLALQEGVVRVDFDADVLEPDPAGALVVLDVVGRVERVHLASQSLHVLLECELRVNSDRVRQAVARHDLQSGTEPQ